jgi:DNA-binding NtrC family response regulator
MNKNRILVVDDEKSVRDILRLTLEYEDCNVSEADSGAAALAEISADPPDAVLLDIKMPGMDGMEVLEKIRSIDAKLPVIILTGHGSIETAVEATRLGAFDFLSKPPDRDKLLITVRNAFKQTRLLRENQSMRREIESTDELIGRSEVMRALIDLIGRVAPTEAYVLVTGENGSGKELVAKALHAGSRRSDKPLVEVNCAAIPADLIESELFGHEKGAFTGATAMRIGKFEQANGGTIFLDEIGDMSPAAQAKVLRVLEEGTFERVGGNRLLHVDTRVIAATNKNLEDEIRKGKFREDLFHRLNVIRIVVPSLGQRTDDIPLLIEHFMFEMARKNKLPERRMDPGAVSLLQRMEWKGNVRELRNAVERLIIMVPDVIKADDVRRYILAPVSELSGVFDQDLTFQDFKDNVESQFIRRQLERNGWNVAKTAEQLDMQRSHLYTKMKKYGLIRDEQGIDD